MLSAGSRGPSQVAQPRRTVRIVKRRIPSRAAALSLAAVAATAVFSFAAWRWWRSDAIMPLPLPPPTLFDVDLDWRCSAGHTFNALGRTGSRQCPQCGGIAFAFAAYHCERHGTYEVQAEFAREADGRERAVKFKVQGGEWADAGDGPHCPRCGAVMVRKQDPLAGVIRGKRKGGG